MPPNDEKRTLWYDKPAQSAMNEALPIGNGRLGGVVFGGTAAERFAFNEDSLWTGDANPSGDYDTMGAYQAFGDLLIDLPGHDAAADYRRTLDIADALAHVGYRAHGITYRREYLASHPAQVVALRLTADHPGAYTGAIRLSDAHGAKVMIAGDTLSAAGALANGLHYESQVQVITVGGTVAPNAMGDGLDFRGCDALTLLLAAGTDYAMDAVKGFRTGVALREKVSRQIVQASAQSYDALRAAHVRDYRALFDRATLDFGASPADRRALPTDRRKVLAASGGDPELETLLFQYGRYLLISCSRPGSLPANLQGLWNDSNDPPWHADYHANINIQMNYWPAEVTGLGDCHLPLFDLIQSQIPDWRKATAAAPDFALADGKPVRGWALRTSHNTMGGMGWNWDKTANAWYARHFYEHWVFTRDPVFLRDVAYPVLKETCEFWQDHLKTLPDGRLVVPNAWSPEHGPVEDGVSYSQEIVWDLFTNYLEAGRALNIDAAYRTQVAAMRDRLVVPAIGRWGQLQEWMTDRTRTVAVIWLLQHKEPDLLLVHLVDLDSDQHDLGPFNVASKATLERTDDLVGQMMAALPADYDLVITSDHGFERVDQMANLNVLLAAHGVHGQVHTMGGLATTDDPAVAAFLRSESESGKDGIGRVTPESELKQYAPALATSLLAVEPADHIMFGSGLPGNDRPGSANGSGGPPPYLTPPAEKGNHGFWPTRHDYGSVFLLSGPDVPHKDLGRIDMISIESRLADVLGLHCK